MCLLCCTTFYFFIIIKSISTLQNNLLSFPILEKITFPCPFTKQSFSFIFLTTLLCEKPLPDYIESSKNTLPLINVNDAPRCLSETWVYLRLKLLPSFYSSSSSNTGIHTFFPVIYCFIGDEIRYNHI